MQDEDVVKRLAFIRYMYQVGVEQSRKSEPLSALSILTFHDSVELFLQLVCVVKGVKSTNITFMSYWDEIKNKTTLILTQKETMRKLNDARVQLKHSGVIPSHFEIVSADHSVTNFFLENTPLVFEMQFESVSMSYFVQCVQAKENLDMATRLIEESKFEESLDKISLAFEQIIDDYELKKVRESGGRSPFSRPQPKSYRMGIKDRIQKEYFKDIDDSIELLQKKIKIFDLGLDAKHYAKFESLTPWWRKDISGHYFSHKYKRDKPLTINDCLFCFDFVVESALHIQELE